MAAKTSRAPAASAMPTAAPISRLPTLTARNNARAVPGTHAAVLAATAMGQSCARRRPPRAVPALTWRPAMPDETEGFPVEETAPADAGRWTCTQDQMIDALHRTRQCRWMNDPA